MSKSRSQATRTRVSWLGGILLFGILGVLSAWWTLSARAGDSSAEAAVTNACDRFEVTEDFDATARSSWTVDGEGGGEYIDWTIRVSGNDYHSIGTSHPDGRVEEYMQVGGHVYWRSQDGIWYTRDDLSSGGMFPECKYLDEFAHLGEDRTLDGLLADHYSSTVGPTGVVNEAETGATTFEYQYWLNDEGTLLQFQRQINHTGVLLDADAGTKGNIQITVLWQLTDIGEANTFTIPTETTPF